MHGEEINVIRSLSRGAVGLALSAALTAGLVVLPAAPAGAAVSFVAATSANNGGSGGSLVIGKPVGVAVNDVMIAQITYESGTAATITVPPGWTLARRTDQVQDIGQAVYHRTVDGSEGPSFSWGLGGKKGSGGILAYRGVDPANPIDVSTGGVGQGTTLTAPSVTTTTAGGVLLALFGTKKNTSLSTAADMTERYENQNSVGGLPSSSANEQTLGAAGATGSRSSTAGESEKWVAQLVGLRGGITTSTLSVVKAGTGYGRIVARPGGLIKCGDYRQQCTAEVENGTVVTLLAQPQGRYTVFESWSGGPCDGSTNRFCEVTITEDVTVTGTFTYQQTLIGVRSDRLRA
jgi:hypothetical protein